MDYDIIIKGGTIVDGMGREGYRADIGVKGGVIASIGALSGSGAGRVIDAGGRTVTPGFIEPHSHADMTLLFHPSMETYLMQGVTTVVSGNCGHGMAPMGDEVYRTAVDADRAETEALAPSFFGALPPLYVEKAKIAPLLREKYGVELDWHSFSDFNRKCDGLHIDCNVAPLVGHSAIRCAVMGMDCQREPTEEELRAMEALTRECMEQGAFGFSTGRDPTYLPSCLADDGEIVRLLKAVGEYGGIFTSHTSNFTPEGDFSASAGYDEFFRQAKAAGVRFNLSHVQLTSEEPSEAMREAASLRERFESLRAGGADFSYDIIPVSDVGFILCPYLASMFAPVVRIAGTRKRFSECLAAADFRQMVRTLAASGMMPSIDTSRSDGIFARIYLTGFDPMLDGRPIAALARERGADPLDAAMDILATNPDARISMGFQPCTGAYDELIYSAIAMPCLDGSSTDKDADTSLTPELPERPAPFYFNGFIRYLTHENPMGFEQRVRQMTSYAAERFGIRGRGVLRPGYAADIVVLDRERLRSYEDDWDEPKYPDGIDYVLVNGVVTIDHKKRIGAAGRVLRKSWGTL